MMTPSISHHELVSIGGLVMMTATVSSANAIKRFGHDDQASVTMTKIRELGHVRDQASVIMTKLEFVVIPSISQHQDILWS
jgi:hypothetical protein